MIRFQSCIFISCFLFVWFCLHFYQFSLSPSKTVSSHGLLHYEPTVANVIAPKTHLEQAMISCHSITICICIHTCTCDCICICALSVFRWSSSLCCKQRPARKVWFDVKACEHPVGNCCTELLRPGGQFSFFPFKRFLTILGGQFSFKAFSFQKHSHNPTFFQVSSLQRFFTIHYLYFYHYYSHHTSYIITLSVL